jgi:ribulose-phosphate 3-epimerase
LIELAPSILSADFARLGEQVRAACDGGAGVVHVDIMDGHFVPNLTIGPPVVKSLRQVTKLPLDCHLMIENPDDFIPAFAAAGADWISVHQEACRHLNRTLHLIKSHDCRAGVVINPATPVDTLAEVLDIVDYVLVMSVNPGFGGQKFIPAALHKIRGLAELRSQRGRNYRIEVDGGGQRRVRQRRSKEECRGAVEGGHRSCTAESLEFFSDCQMPMADLCGLSIGNWKLATGNPESRSYVT